MIQNNNTFFQVAKRFALVVLLIGVSNAIWAGGMTHGRHYTRVKASANVNGNSVAKGLVYVSDKGEVTNTDLQNKWTEQDNNVTTNFTYQTGQYSSKNAVVTETSADKYQECQESSETDLHTYNIYAKEIDGYYFAGWERPNGDKIPTSTSEEDGEDVISNLDLNFEYITTQDQRMQPAQINIEEHEGNSIFGGSYTYTTYELEFPYTLEAVAKWVLPQVTTVNNSTSNYFKSIPIEDPAESKKEETLTFVTSNGYKEDNFTVLISVDEETYDANRHTYFTYTKTYSDGIFTIVVTYIPTKVHNTNHSITVTVSSNFEGNTDYGRNNNISKTGTLSFTEDYTPRFEVIEESITLAIQNDGTANSKDQGYDLTPSFLNIVASSHAAWTINITGNGFSQSPDNGVQYSPIVSFTEPTNSNENTFEGTLTLTCKYDNIDPEGTTIDGTVTDETRLITTKIIHLKATNDPTIKFGTGTENNLNATISTISGEGSNATYRFTTNIDNINEQWNVETLLGGHNPTESHNITYTPQELSPEVTEVQVIIPSTILPGTYKTQLVASGTGTKITTNENNENIETTVTESATLTVTATVELATPEISAILGSECKVGISWEPIYGATEYYISSTEPKINQEGTLSFTQIAKLEPTVTEKDLGTLAENSTYTYYVIAACYKGATLVDAKWNSISITPANYPDRITLQGSDNSVAANNTGLETGTKSEGSFPNRAMRPIDVTSAFASDGTALMNRLYIFGFTNEKLETPCYVYTKENSTTYKFTHMVTNMNQEKKDSHFSRDAQNEKIYFTGYCPFAATGNAYNENAVFHVTNGDKDHGVDIYLDNLQIYARNKGEATHNIIYNDKFNNTNTVMHQESDNVFYAYPVGSGAVFAFSSTESSLEEPSYFMPKVHIRNNDNILDATYGLSINYDIKNLGQGSFPRKISSPIEILLTVGDDGLNQRTKLTIDDIWADGSRTNGTLKLQGENDGTNPSYIEDNNAPSIDLGNQHTILVIAGGKITMNGVDNNNYAISARKQQIEQSGKTIHTYGFGVTDNTIGKVYFQDGTISAASSPLKCPTNTIIDGGSFICDVQAGNAVQKDLVADEDIELLAYTNINSSGDNVYRIPADITESVGSVENGLAIFNTELTNNKDGFQILMDNIFPLANFKTKNQDNQEVYASLSEYYTSSTKYGRNSLAPEGTKVYLMLPQDGTISSYTGWSLCVPKVEKLDQNVGGDVDIVSTTGETNVESTTKIPVAQSELKLTNRLLYAEVDDVTQSVIKDLDLKDNNATIELGHHVTNDAAYVINEKVYMLLPVVAGEWRMIVAPFDVHNVYAIEAYPEDMLKKVYGEEKRAGSGRYYIKDIEGAQKAQARRLLDLLVYWMGVENLDTDFFGAAGGYGPFVNTWMNYEASATGNKNGAVVEGNYTPKIEQLYHFTGTDGAYPAGMNWYDANYYLYKSADGSWELNNETGIVTTDWEEVTEQSTPRTEGTPNVIMQKGGFYSMQFPSAYTSDGWDYWNGKYILLEGYGPQTIDGSSTINTLISKDTEGNYRISTPTSGVQLYGNGSFAKSGTLTHEHLYHTAKNDNGVLDLVRKTDEKVFGPIEGFAIGNLDATTRSMNDEGQTIQTQKIAKAIKMETGEVMYEVKTEIIDNGDPGLGSGIPTIMNGMTLIVEPTEQGLTITPIKVQHVMLFDANGKMIFSKYLSAEENVTLPTGVYVVRGEYEQVKAIKK